MTRILTIISGKGGVGKTTLTSNLAASLSYFGEDVTALDANFTTPNLGLHLGMYLTSRTIHDILSGEERLKNAIYPHPLGFKVIPGSLNVDDLKGVDATRLSEITFRLLGKSDYVIIDSAAGLGRESMSALAASDEVLLITNPDLPSVTDALRTLKIIQTTNLKLVGVVINRIKGEKHELSKTEIEKILGVPVVAEIPEDNNIPMSVMMKIPVVEYAPNSPASVEIKKLAAKLAGRKYEPPMRTVSFWRRFVKWLTR